MNVDLFIKRFIQFLALIFVIAWSWFIIAEKAEKGKIYLDSNDGWVIFICLSVLFAIGSVIDFLKRKIQRK